MHVLRLLPVRNIHTAPEFTWCCWLQLFLAPSVEEAQFLTAEDKLWLKEHRGEASEKETQVHTFHYVFQGLKGEEHGSILFVSCASSPACGSWMLDNDFVAGAGMYRTCKEVIGALVLDVQTIAEPD